MLFSPRRLMALAALASLVAGSPTPVGVALGPPQHDLLFREAVALAHQPHIEKRLSADFDMARSWKNEVLFHGSYTTVDAIGVTDSVALAVTCVDCYTKGRVTAKLTDEAIIDPTVRLEFAGVEAYVDLRVAMSVGATYSLNLFTSESPIGLGFPGLSVGVVFYVDLVFSLTDAIDLEGGFYVKVADDAFLEASVFGGDITKSFFNGLSSKSLPITVHSGSATFKADLRLRVQCGAEAGIAELGLGASAELGIYANLIEFVAVLESTPTCALQSTEWWDLNVGAFAHLDVVIDYRTLGAIPSVSTTLLSAPTATQCWIGRGGDVTSVRSATVIGTSSPVAVVTASTRVATVTTLSERPSSSASGVATSVSSPTTAAFSTRVSASASASAAGSVVTSALSTISYGMTNSSTAATATVSANSSSTDVDLVTSTVSTTSIYTITACAASVVNCPASYQSEIVVTQTVDLYTTICPATATLSTPAPTQTASNAEATVVTVDLINDIIVLVPCETPVVETFVAPSSTPSGVPTSVSVQSSLIASPTSLGPLKNEGKYQNGTVSGTVSGAVSASASGTGFAHHTNSQASASAARTSTAVPGQSTVVTAGAGRVLSSGLVIVGLGWACQLLLF